MGDHLEIERKYDADAEFVLPDLGDLPEPGSRPDPGGGRPEPGGGRPEPGGGRPEPGGGLPEPGGGLPEPGGRRIADPRRIYLSATYFDTEGFDLLKHKVTLRRRVGGDDEGWHLKLPVRENTRQELHAPLDEGDDGSVPARLAAQVEEITAGKRLHPIAILDTERTVVRLPGPPADPLVEVADDKVTATRFDVADGEPMTWREIEVEALSADSGATAMLETVGQALREAGARPSASGSKLARVLNA